CRLPPLARLFPYTTLFRSSHSGVLVVGECEPVPVVGPGLAGSLQPDGHAWCLDRDGVCRRGIAVRPLGVGADGERVVRERVAGEDRKSTRLNSSHVAISYA